MSTDAGAAGLADGAGQRAGAAGAELSRESGSFRDPDSRVLHGPDAVYRALSARGLEDWQKVAEKGTIERLIADGRVVETELLADGQAELPESLRDDHPAVLRHRRIPFVSYPYEWPFGMLRDAALLQLELLRRSLADDLILKDASSYNVQWQGARPVFVDVGSFEPLREGEPWVGYRQFCMLFLYPLLLEAHKGVAFQPWLRGAIDGIPPSQFAGLFHGSDRFKSGVFKHVLLHARLERRYAGREESTSSEVRKAGFSKRLIEANVQGLEKLIRGLEPPGDATVWSEYGATTTYSAEDAERKAAFVREAAASRRWKLAWDLGCNDGHYSRMVAEQSDYLVAVDADPAAVEQLYASLKQDGPDNVLPLTMNLADPSPNLGWRGLERRSMPERGRPDLVIGLALIHHVAISANVPVAEFVDWLRELGASIVLEWVDREDPMASKLLKAKREGLHADYELGHFERCIEAAFDVERRQELAAGKRILFFAHPKQGAGATASR